MPSFTPCGLKQVGDLFTFKERREDAYGSFRSPLTYVTCKNCNLNSMQLPAASAACFNIDLTNLPNYAQPAFADLL